MLCFRGVVGRMSEWSMVDADRLNPVAHCSVTRYEPDSSRGCKGGLSLREYNMTVSLLNAGTHVTVDPDARATSP
jgi:hypothetical protein